MCETCSSSSPSNCVTGDDNRVNDDDIESNGCETGCSTVTTGLCNVKHVEALRSVSALLARAAASTMTTTRTTVARQVAPPSRLDRGRHATALRSVPALLAMTTASTMTHRDYGCEMGCPTVASGTRETCSRSSERTGVSCGGNRFNDDGSANNGYEMNAGAKREQIMSHTMPSSVLAQNASGQGRRRNSSTR